jgi:hypothetical protein
MTDYNAMKLMYYKNGSAIMYSNFNTLELTETIVCHHQGIVELDIDDYVEVYQKLYSRIYQLLQV